MTQEDLPAGWIRRPLAQLGQLISGQSPSTADVNRSERGTAYISGPEQWDGARIHIDRWTTSPVKIAPDNSVFIVVKGAGVGKTFPGVNAAIGRDLMAFAPFRPLEPDYFQLVLADRAAQLLSRARGHNTWDHQT